MKLVAGILSLLVAAVLVARSIVALVPDCETIAGIKRLVSPETTCTSQTGLGILLALAAVTIAAAALRILSHDRRPRAETSP